MSRRGDSTFKDSCEALNGLNYYLTYLPGHWKSKTCFFFFPDEASGIDFTLAITSQDNDVLNTTVRNALY